MSSSLAPGAQPQIDVSNGTATAAVVLSVPQASAPSVAITGPSSSTYINSLGMGATSPEQELVVSCTSGDTINVSGEISGVSPALPVFCPGGGVLNFSFDYADNTVSGAAGSRLVQVSATNGTGLTSYDSAVYYRAPGAPTITAPAAASNVGLMSTVTGACAAGAVVSISNSNLSPNPTTGTCAGNNTYSIPVQFSALTTGSQTLSATQTAAGLTSAATTSSVVVDNTRPSLSMSQASPYVGHNGSSPFNVSVSFSESVTGLSASDFVVVGGTAALSGGPQNYILTITPTANTAITVDLAANMAQSVATNNGNIAATQLSIPHDGAVPTISITSTAGSVTSASPIPVSVSFSEPVLASTVSAGDFTVSSGTIGSFSCLPAIPSTFYNTCTFNVTGMTANTNLVVGVNATVTVSDLAQNLSAAPNAASLTILYDTAAPTITSIAATSGFPAIGNTIGASTTSLSVDVTFSENMASSGAGAITAADFAASNASITSVSCSTATLCTVVMNTSASTSGSVSLALATLPAAVIQDVAGNNLSGGMSSTSWTMDKTAPTISSIAATSGFPAIGNTIGGSTTSLSVAVTFSENMASSGAGAITAADFAASNASITSVSCSTATLCTVVMNTSASTSGSVSLALATLPAAVIQDVAGNNLSGGMSSTSWTMDKTAPIVTISVALDIDDSNKYSYSATGTCSEVGVDVIVYVGSQSIIPSPPCIGNTWSITAVDVSNLNNGTILIHAQQSDAFQTGSMNLNVTKSTVIHQRDCHSATLLNDGRVLVIGGDSSNQSQIYSPSTNAWETSDYIYPADTCPYSGLLADGNVLVVSGNPSQSAYGTSSWTDASNGLSGYLYHQSDLTYNANMILLDDGRMALVTRGSDELWAYDPTLNFWTNYGRVSPVCFREAANPIKLDDGRLFVANGAYTSWETPVGTFFDPLTNTFSDTSPIK
jgi:hypothetical protein